MEIREDLRSEIGKGLQWLRKSLALTQYQLAALAQLDYRHYQNIETGRVEVKVETLKRICDAFGFTLGAFFSLLEKKLWLNEKGDKIKGNGEVFVFRIEHEHSSFRMFDEVRQILFSWGRELAECNKESLLSNTFPCIEVDRHGRCLWKNTLAQDFTNLPTGGNLSEFFASRSDFGYFLKSLESFFSSKSRSVYGEGLVSPQLGGPLKFYALVGLSSLMQKELPSLFLACVDVTAYFKSADQDTFDPELTQTLLSFYNKNLKLAVRGSSGGSEE